MNFPSKRDDFKKIEKNNVTITLNVLHAKKEKPFPSYVSKHNSNREKQFILLMIQNGEKQQKALYFIKKTINIIKRKYVKK